ncbi:MAG: prenyltransferase/squalene oxidase repeat-containing protein [Planctomycetota bacterium]
MKRELPVAASAWLVLLSVTPLHPALGDEAPSSPHAYKTLTTMSAEDARRSIDRAVHYLLSTQREDGSWGTSTLESLFELEYSNESFYSWKLAATALACMALLEVAASPERQASLERVLHWLVTARLPKRCSDWDIDNNWANLYGFQAMARAARDERFQGEAWKTRIEERGGAFYALLEKNQDPLGGWGYYEGDVISRRPTWSTSFATACVIPALLEAQGLGWPIDARVLERAVKYVRRCRLPCGSYLYDLTPIPQIDGGESINGVKGSLGRTQVCNWALARARDPGTPAEVIRRGIETFFREHKFLFLARLKPVPHESFYANAGYFYYFGHYYAALAVNLLPANEREAWHARLRPFLIATQRRDGASSDFVGSSYVWAACTAFSIMALQAGLETAP